MTQVSKQVVFNPLSYRLYIIGVFLLIVAGAVNATPRPANDLVQTPILQPVKHAFFDALSIDKYAKLGEYRRIYIDDVKVTFSSRWLKAFQRTTSTRYRERIRLQYSELVKAQLSAAFTKHRQYTVLDAPAADALRVQVNITDLSIGAPDTQMIAKSYVRKAATARLHAGLFAGTEITQQLAMIRDQRDTPAAVAGELKRATRATNYRDFRLLVTTWSKQIVKLVMTTK